MKKFVLSLLFFVSVFIVSAQPGGFYKKKKKKKTFPSFGIGSPAIKYTRMGGKSLFITGGYIGWKINNHVLIGYGIYKLAHKANIYNPRVSKEQVLQFGYGGPIVEYIFYPDYKYHFNTTLMIGAGGYSLDAYGLDFFACEPAVNFISTMTKWARLSTGISYRYVNSKAVLIEDKTYRGFSANVHLLLTYSEKQSKRK